MKIELYSLAHFRSHLFFLLPGILFLFLASHTPNSLDKIPLFWLSGLVGTFHASVVNIGPKPINHCILSFSQWDSDPDVFWKLLVKRNPISWAFHEEEIRLGLLAATPVIVGACLGLELTQIRARQKDGERQDPGDIIWIPGSSHPQTFQLH